MTATTAGTTTSEPVEASQPAAPAAHPLTGLLGPIALVLGSVLAAVGQWLHLPAMPEDVGIAVAIGEASSAWMTSHLLLGFGFALIAMGATATLPRHRGRGAGLMAAGLVVIGFGAAVTALGDIAHGALGFALVGPVDAATSFEVQSSYFTSPMAPPLNLGSMLLPLGMILTGIGVFRSRLHPRWVGVAIAVSPFAVLAGFNSGLEQIALVPMAVGMSLYALSVARRTRTDPSQPRLATA